MLQTNFFKILQICKKL